MILYTIDSENKAERFVNYIKSIIVGKIHKHVAAYNSTNIADSTIC